MSWPIDAHTKPTDGPHPMAGDPPPHTRARLLSERDRVCDRLRSMSLARLGARLESGDTRAELALRSGQVLADLGARVAGEPLREVPDLPAHAVGDVVAVMVNDIVAGLDARGWDEAAADLCASAVAELVALRRAL